MIELSRAHSIQGEFTLNPDRENLLLALTVGAISRGRTIIEDCPHTPIAQEYVDWLIANQVDVEYRTNSWVIEGKGIQNSFNALQSLPAYSTAKFLALCLLSVDCQTVFDFGSDYANLNAQNTSELKTLNIDIQHIQLFSLFNGSFTNGRFQFSTPSFKFKLNGNGVVDHFTRIRLLLQAILFEERLVISESGTAKDSLARLLQFFGAPIKIENNDPAELDELSRRMARMSGQKQEKRTETIVEPCKMLTGKELVVPCDTTEASIFALLACLLPSSDITLKNVGVANGRAGIFSAFKRMGANIELTQRKDRYGDSFATIRALTSKRFVGRKIAGETIASALDEVPVLALACALAEGESILRIPAQIVVQERALLELLVQNLKLCSIDVGLYEEGLVIRGREEIDAGDYETGGFATLALGLAGTAKIAHGKAKLLAEESTFEYHFPGILPQLRAL